jgi:DNA modification methylase
MSVRILVGDCRERLRDLPDESVQCVVTSPPYFGLRDYRSARQIGLEDDPAAFVAALVEVFREVRRVLRADGTLWLNLGDSYAASGNGGHRRQRPQGQTGQMAGRGIVEARDLARSTLEGRRDRKTPLFHGHNDRGIAERLGERRRPPDGLKSKDLIGIPWRVAFALQADGWFLRQDIVWDKPNPMPESVGDRCTKAHEYVFLLTKSERYRYDAGAIAEPSNYPPGCGKLDAPKGAFSSNRGDERPAHDGPEPSFRAIRETRNKRSVWRVASEPYRGDLCTACGAYHHAGAPTREIGGKRVKVCSCGATDAWVAHFATFPPGLIEPCILAGAPPGAVVLDPFGGAGTTGLVADRLGRSALLLELNPDYAEMARQRLMTEAGLLADVRVLAA